MIWLLVIAVLIVVAFGVVVWLAWDPKHADRIEEDSRLPLHEVGVSDLDEPEDREPPDDFTSIS